MAKKNDNAPTGKWYAAIAGTLGVYVLIMLFAFIIGNYFVRSVVSGAGVNLTSAPAILQVWLPVIGVIICMVIKPLLDQKRQALRDEVEYDAFGNSRKKTFSSMSKEERKRIEEQKAIESERILPSTVIKSATHEAPANPEEELNKLIGLSGVKQVIRDMAAQMQFDYENRKDKKSQISEDEENAYHMCFSGPAGTGKTTCARIITGFLYKYKVIKKNKCIEIDGNTMRGSTPAETTQKVLKFIHASIGGVLFIDEAYSLISNKDDNREAVATLIKYMEDYRHEFVVILAGYDNEIKQLIASNPGFASRIQHYINFPSYSTPELDDIFRTMAGEQGYAVDGAAYEKFESIMDEERRKAHFGNARTVRNCLSASVRLHKSNYIQGNIKNDKKYILCSEDITFEKGILG